MDQVFPLFGSYFWWILAGLLLIGELMQPGFFLIWIAGAAAVTGLIHFVHPLAWEAEVLVFAVLSAILVAATWRMVSRSWQVKSDQPHLNKRQDAMIGRTFGLSQAIVNGYGKISDQGTLWDVEGPDLPAGAKVTVTGLDGLRLKVKKHA